MDHYHFLETLFDILAYLRGDITYTNIGRSIIIQGNKKMEVNRLNPVQKATYFKKNQKWEKMKNVQ